MSKYYKCVSLYRAFVFSINSNIFSTEYTYHNNTFYKNYCNKVQDKYVHLNIHQYNIVTIYYIKNDNNINLWNPIVSSVTCDCLSSRFRVNIVYVFILFIHYSAYVISFGFRGFHSSHGEHAFQSLYPFTRFVLFRT